MKRQLLTLMVAAALATNAQAQSPAPRAAAAPAPAPAPAAAETVQRAELERARSELAEAARRVAELTREVEGERFRLVAEDLRLESRRARLGVVLAARDEGDGVRIAAVTPGGPAARAGLRSGDVLASLDGKRLVARGEAAVQEVRERLAGLEKGQDVVVGYRRDGKPGQATVEAGEASRVMVFNGDEDFKFEFDGERVRALELSELAELRAQPLLHPGIEMEVARIAAAPCPPGEDCPLPVLSQAFRWSGLNLASVDAKLGRYFGTDRGVLVLGTGAGLEALEPGDVIQRIDGKPVATPRDAMAALRGQDAGEKVSIEVLRDRKARTVQATVPEAPSFRWFAPPAPPAPPVPPTPPAPPAPRGAAAPEAPPTPPTPPAPPPPDVATVTIGDGVVARIVRDAPQVD